MKGLNIPTELIRLFEHPVEDTECYVRIQSDLSELMRNKEELRQGDYLECLLFSVALEQIIGDSEIWTAGKIFYKYVQILAYAVGVHIIGKTLTALRGAL
jgi:hypothetical protein